MSAYDDTLFDIFDLVLLLVPGVRSDFPGAVPLGRVGVEDFFEEVSGVVGDELGNLEFSGHDFFVELGGVGVLEGKVSADECEHDDSGTPDIDAETVIAFTGDHFWGCVAGGSAGCFEEISRFVGVGESEIDDFDIFILIEEKVFGFEISVGDSECMEIFDSGDNLLDVFAAFFFVNSS